jgi:hypothetical protein
MLTNDFMNYLTSSVEVTQMATEGTQMAKGRQRAKVKAFDQITN